jgi:hypothetical protein
VKDLFELNVRLYRLWWEAVETQSAAWTTIAMRLPHLAQQGLRPGRPPSRETQKMVAEKVAAAAEGAREASIASARLAGKMLTRPLRATELAVDVLKVAEAAARPAKQRVKANAARLTRHTP